MESIKASNRLSKSTNKMPITAQNQQEAKEFMSAINNLMAFVEVMSQHIPEGKYLEMMNELKTIYGFKPAEDTPITVFVQQAVVRVRATPQYGMYSQQAVMKLLGERTVITDARKLSSGWKMCNLCDAIVKDMKEHQLSRKCRIGKEAKCLCISTKEMDNIRLNTFITKLRSIRMRVKFTRITGDEYE
jgi:hypothetical protein